jgi:hypothetical protein
MMFELLYANKVSVFTRQTDIMSRKRLVLYACTPHFYYYTRDESLETELLINIYSGGLNFIYSRGFFSDRLRIRKSPNDVQMLKSNTHMQLFNENSAANVRFTCFRKFVLRV